MQNIIHFQDTLILCFLLHVMETQLRKKRQVFLLKRKKTFKADYQKETPIKTGLKCR